jgi:hypothetical protein
MKRTGLLLGLLLASCGSGGSADDYQSTITPGFWNDEYQRATVRFHIELDADVYFPAYAVYRYLKPEHRWLFNTGTPPRCIAVIQTVAGWRFEDIGHSSGGIFYCSYRAPFDAGDSDEFTADAPETLTPVDFDGYWFDYETGEIRWHVGTGLAVPRIAPQLP